MRCSRARRGRSRRDARAVAGEAVRLKRMFLTDNELRQLTGRKSRKNNSAREWARLNSSFQMPYPNYTAEQRSALMRVVISGRHARIAESRARAKCSVLPLDQARALPVVASGLYEVPGVYFLWSSSRLVYIGSSKDVRGRFLTHARERGWVITSATYAEAHPNILRSLEEMLIKKHRPQYNITWCRGRHAP
jgi:hypothetical protein